MALAFSLGVWSSSANIDNEQYAGLSPDHSQQTQNDGATDRIRSDGMTGMTDARAGSSGPVYGSDRIGSSLSVYGMGWAKW